MPPVPLVWLMPTIRTFSPIWRMAYGSHKGPVKNGMGENFCTIKSLCIAQSHCARKKAAPRYPEIVGFFQLVAEACGDNPRRPSAESVGPGTRKQHFQPLGSPQHPGSPDSSVRQRLQFQRLLSIPNRPHRGGGRGQPRHGRRLGSRSPSARGRRLRQAMRGRGRYGPNL